MALWPPCERVARWRGEAAPVAYGGTMSAPAEQAHAVEAVDGTTVAGRAQTAIDHGADAVALLTLAALPGPFLPWTAFSMRPAAIAAVLTEIVLGDREVIVELGSGNSTIYMARLIRQRASGAHILSVDHDREWAERTRLALKREGLSHVATVVDAPLRNGWYDPTAIPSTEGVDLLVIDGPPAYQPGTGRSREPALDHFAAALTADATIILDDARRPGEQAVIAAWEARHNRAFTLQPGGHALSAPHLV